MKIAVRMVTAARAKSAKSDRSFQDAWACLKRFDYFLFAANVSCMYTRMTSLQVRCPRVCLLLYKSLISKDRCRIGASMTLRCCELSYIDPISRPRPRPGDPRGDRTQPRPRVSALDLELSIGSLALIALGSARRLDLRARGRGGPRAPLRSRRPDLARTCATLPHVLPTVPTKAARSGGV